MQRNNSSVLENKENIIIAEDIKVWYPIRKLLSIIGYVHAVDGVSFNVKRGEITAIVGESGCGKSTLARTIVGLVPITSGRIVFDGVDIVKLPRAQIRKWYSSQIGYVQQDPYGAMPPFMSIKAILEEPMKIHNVPKKERIERVYSMLSEVGLTPPEDFVNKYPHMLSGGQLQRVAIARALILRPKLVVADEPVSMLDASVRIEILTLFKELKEKYNLSVIYITHDFATAKYFSDNIIVMYAGQFVEKGPAMDVIHNPKHPYTKALLSVLPDPDPRNRSVMRKTLPGEPPSLINPPSGCRFYPRCPYAMDKCRNQDPPMVQLEINTQVKCWLYA
ncbi:MAG: ABC transporter ATP-binding protein [Ignisphaera sp.]|uniref:ABC transporter ATP-binding protein n=1 Tax=Ignisphaera aggregans TaxID=334771 RepID=A0A7C4JKN0_9CREN